VAKKLIKKAHHIVIANTRGLHTIGFADNEGIRAVELRDAAKDVNVVIISIPFTKVAELPKNLFSELNKNVPVIETMNYFLLSDGLIEDLENGKLHSEWVSERIGRPVVKAFNDIAFVVAFLCSNDSAWIDGQTIEVSEVICNYVLKT